MDRNVPHHVRERPRNIGSSHLEAPPRPGRRLPAPPRRRLPSALGRLLWPAALVVVTLLAYLPAMRAGFIWDDDDYVTDNRTLSDLDGLRRIWLEPGAVPQYYPLVHTSFWIEHHLWALRPAGYHAVNILLHALGSVLLWLALRRLGIRAAGPAALVFAIHPVQVESVAWITERKNVLSTVFYLASALAWFKLLGSEAGAGGQIPKGATFDGPLRLRGDSRRTRLYIASIFFFVCALLSKTVTGSLPLVLLLLGWWKSGRVDRSHMRWLLPFLFLAAAMGSVTLWMERNHVLAQGKDWDLSLVDRVLVAGRAFWFYLLNFVWPFRLSFLYPRWEMDPAAVWPLLLPLAVLLVGVGLWLGRRLLGRAPITAFLFYGVTLFPALGFFNVYPMMYTFAADHYQYLACLGPIALAAAGLDKWSARPAGGFRRQTLVAAAGTAVLVLLAALTFQRAKIFQDPETLWLDTLAKNPGAWMAHHNLGKLYEEQGDPDEAMAQYRRALAIRPDLDNTLYNLGNVLAGAGGTEEALRSYTQALEVNPTFVEAHNNIGNLLHKSGRTEEAATHYRRALELVPEYAPAHRNLAFLLADAGRTAEAVEHLQAAVRADPEHHPTLNRLAWLLATSHDPAVRNGREAIELAERACSLAGDAAAPYLLTLAAAHAEAGSFDQALTIIARARDLASRSGRADLVQRCDALAELYRAHQPLRVAP